MDQAEHIESLIHVSMEQADRSDRVQNAYLEYVSNGRDESFTALVQFMDSYSISWIRRQLRNAGCYTDENEHTILQESRLAVWESAMKDRSSGSVRESFARYAFGIYKNKALDEIRKVSRRRAKLDVCSFEEPVGDSGKTIEDVLPPVTEDMGEREEIRWLYEKLFHTYCAAFLTSPAFPPRSLALYYARVLPHLAGEIPDTKATSAKWAFETMGNRTIGSLKADSESTLQQKVDQALRWCGEFVKQLDHEADIPGQTGALKDLVYTAVYDKGKIEDWADYMHKATVKRAMDSVVHEPELLEKAREYVSRKDVLYQFVKGGAER